MPVKGHKQTNEQPLASNQGCQQTVASLLLMTADMMVLALFISYQLDAKQNENNQY